MNEAATTAILSNTDIRYNDSFSALTTYYHSEEHTTIPSLSVSIVITTLENINLWLWYTMPPFLLCVGLIGNGLIILVISRLGVEHQPTLVFLLFLAITDSVVLLTGLPRYWISNVFDFDLKTVGNVTCKLYYFFIYLSMQYSSWILVGVSLERVAKTYFPFTYKRLFGGIKVTVALCTTLLLLSIVNGHFFFTNGINDYTEGDCGSLNEDFFYFDEHIFVYVDFCLLSLMPFTIMMISSILLIRVLQKANRARASMVHQSVLEKANRFSVRMTQMLVVCTVYFLLATTPISAYFIADTYLMPTYEAEENNYAIASMDLIWAIAYLLQFSNYCVNFYLYAATNRRFYDEMRIIICRGQRSQKVSVYRLQNDDRTKKTTENTVTVDIAT